MSPTTKAYKPKISVVLRPHPAPKPLLIKGAGCTKIQSRRPIIMQFCGYVQKSPDPGLLAKVWHVPCQPELSISVKALEVYEGFQGLADVKMF